MLTDPCPIRPILNCNPVSQNSRGAFDDLVEGTVEQEERQLGAELKQKMEKVKLLENEMENMQDVLDELGGDTINEKGKLAKGLSKPDTPTREERELHNLTHTPYRAWCKYCVRGRGKKLAHTCGKAEDESETATPRISMDYFFMSAADDEQNTSPVIVLVDESTGDKSA